MTTELKTETIASGSNNKSCISPITMDYVNARLLAFKGYSPEAHCQERTRACIKVDSAHKDAELDIMEAVAKLHIRQLDFDATFSAEAKGSLLLDLNVKLENIRASRKLEKIFDELSTHAASFEKIADAAKADEEFTTSGEAEIAALQTRLAALRERMLPVLKGKMARLEKSFRALVEVIMHGEWKRASDDDKAECLKFALNQLVNAGFYTGDTTEAAAKQRISDIEHELEKLHKDKNNQLTEDEVHEFQAGERRILEIGADILKAQQARSGNSASVQAAQ
ncbi:MAG: hypothetical protein WCL29_03140 [Pseudomonadota bacterium]